MNQDIELPMWAVSDLSGVFYKMIIFEIRELKVGQLLAALAEIVGMILMLLYLSAFPLANLTHRCI
jgi:hypothetical protein